jgi:hypothetical protein
LKGIQSNCNREKLICSIFSTYINSDLTGIDTFSNRRFSRELDFTDGASEFQLPLVQSSGNILSGTHCSVQRRGARIDCGLDSLEASISGIVKDSSIVIVTFKSFYGGSSGKATIKKIGNSSIEWKIIEKPKGEFYLPMKAFLNRQ